MQPNCHTNCARNRHERIRHGELARSVGAPLSSFLCLNSRVIRRGDVERGADCYYNAVGWVAFAALNIADRRTATAGELAELSLRDLLAAAAQVDNFTPGRPIDIYHHGGIIARLSTAL